jgi:hypothetical protein
MPKPTWSSFIVVVATGTIACLVKITTFPAFLFLGGLFFLKCGYIAFREGQNSDRWKTFVFALAACTIPIVTTYAWVIFSDSIKAAGNPLAQSWTSTALWEWNFGTISQRLTPVYWAIVVRRVPFDVFGYGAIFAIMVAGTFLTNGRYVIQMLAAGLAFLVPLLLFFNLHFIHDYYQYANGVFLIIVVGLGITNLFDAGRARLGISFLTLIVAGQIAYFYNYFGEYLTADYSTDPAFRLAAVARRLTNENQSLLVLWPDGTPEVPFYSQRKSLVLGHEIPTRIELMQQVFDNPQSFLGDSPLGGIAYCKDFLEKGDARPLIDAFLSGRKVLGRDGDCEVLSAFR